MHISEGVLNPEILVGGAVVSAILVVFSAKNVKSEDIPKTAVLSAVFFLASFIHVPIGATSVHLILGGLIGAFLGYGAILAIFIALVLQGVLFGYGGVTTLGVNTFILATPSLLGYFLMSIKTSSDKMQKLYWFLVGFLPTFTSALLLSAVLSLNGEKFLPVAYLSFMSNLPIMFIEGFIVLFSIIFIKKTAPNLLKENA